MSGLVLLGLLVISIAVGTIFHFDTRLLFGVIVAVVGVWTIVRQIRKSKSSNKSKREDSNG